MSRLVDPLEGTDAARLAQCLGLDPNDYRHHSSGLGAEAERSGAERSDEDRFRECEKLKVSKEIFQAWKTLTKKFR